MQQRDSDQGMPPVTFGTYRVLIPPVAGLALASAVVNVVVQQAHRTTGVSTFNGLGMLLAAVALAALYLSTLSVARFTKRFVSRFLNASLLLAGACCAALSLASATRSGLALPWPPGCRRAWRRGAPR